MELVATYPILYRSHQYEIGESLPADDAKMVHAWLDAGTAVWQDKEQVKLAKAIPAAAEAGMAGQSRTGKLPRTWSEKFLKQEEGGRTMDKRPTFKELLRQDVKTVFLNPVEFGEEHMVNGKKMLIIIDDNELTEREKRIQSHMDGIYKKQTLIFVSALDYGPLPGPGKPVVIDNIHFIVTDSMNEGGVYSIHLEANRS